LPYESRTERRLRNAGNEIALLHVCAVSGLGYVTTVHTAQVRCTRA
jgi:hypothetical protein